MTDEDYEALKGLMKETEKLMQDIRRIYAKTNYEDLEHAVIGLEIVKHALGEVEENKGMGGRIEPVSDSKAHLAAKKLLDGVTKLQRESSELLRTHANEDLETAVKALGISKGSLEEVLARYP